MSRAAWEFERKQRELERVCAGQEIARLRAEVVRLQRIKEAAQRVAKTADGTVYGGQPEADRRKAVAVKKLRAALAVGCVPGSPPEEQQPQ